jgi:PAS domain S-box-containing protein
MILYYWGYFYNAIFTISIVENVYRRKIMIDKNCERKIKTINPGEHIACIYSNKREQVSAAIPFIIAGLESNEKCIYITDENTKEELIQAFKEKIHIKPYRESGQFEIITSKDTYFKGGFFDPDRMITLLKQLEKDAVTSGYNGLRITGEMMWVFTCTPATEKLIEYETKLNSFFSQSTCTALCLYNEKKFGPEILLDIIHTHPRIIIYDSLYENFLYIPPDEFLTKINGKKLWNTYEKAINSIISGNKIYRDINGRKQAEKEKEKILHVLNERVKELSFFYNVDKFIRKYTSIEEILEKTVYVIPKSWQYPEITESCITLGNKEYKTNNFKETEWMQKADIMVDNEKAGIVAVCYLEERPTEDEGPFLKEERKLITAVAERLGDFIEHKKAEKLIRESEKRFRSLFETAPSAIVCLSPDHRILEFNTEAEQIFGVKREEILGKDYFELFLPENIQDTVAADMKKVLKGKLTKGFENVVITHDGRERLLTWNVKCLFDSENRPTGIIAVGLDITDRKKTEEALQESEEKYRDLVENLNDVIYAVDTEGVVTYVSPSIEMFIKYKPSEVIGRHFGEFFYQEDLSYLTENFQNILKGHYAANEYRVLTKSGDMRWMRTSSRPVFTGDGVTGAQGVLSDITERKKADEQIRTLSSAVEQSTDGIAIGSMDSMLMYVNETFAQMHGYSPEEIVGMNIAHLHNEEQMDEYRKKMNIAKTEGSWMGEIGHIRKDGTPFPTFVALTLLKDDRGNPTGILEVIRDITERKKAEEKINASLKEKEILLREIHHRVKNNLQVISSLLSLQSNALTDDTMREVFNESQNRIKSMALVHENLYQSENLASIDFREYIEALTSGLFQSYGGDADKITFSILMDDISLGIDTAIPCGLIINELVANSLKHAFPHGKKGEIKIELHSVDDTLELIVSDNGRGIPGDIDFKKTESLGLKLVTVLAEDQLDGEITLDMEEGTTFHITWHKM